MEAARSLNAFSAETPDRALAMAEAADERRAQGDVRGPLDGIPIAVKDLFCTEGVLSTAGSHILDGCRRQNPVTKIEDVTRASARPLEDDG